MSEMERITKLMAEQGSVGAIPETNFYRADGPTRTMVHVLARANGMKVRTSIERIREFSEHSGEYLLWYRLVGR